MNFLLLIMLDISASADDSPDLIIARKPLEAMITDWLRQKEEIHLLRNLVAGQTRACRERSRATPSDRIR
jgi:hypothetical protein